MYKDWKILKSKINRNFELSSEDKKIVSNYEKQIESAKDIEKFTLRDKKEKFIREKTEEFEKSKKKALEEYGKVVNWCVESRKYQIDDMGEYYAVVETPQPTQEQLNQAKITELKEKLAATDYVVAKIAEVETEEEKAALREEYAEVLVNRKAWRSEINELEADIA